MDLCLAQKTLGPWRLAERAKQNFSELELYDQLTELLYLRAKP